MKIAFVGKGGSGKSTMCTAFTKHCVEQGYNVLSIDADHNMDLSYNLGAEPTIFLGNDPDDIKVYVGAQRENTFAESIVIGRENNKSFHLSPTDTYTSAHSHVMSSNLRLMVAGPHTDKVRSQNACSHSLAAPLKVYLPLLKLQENEVVTIDERAGTDPVATGILHAVDLAVIVREPTVHSTRVAAQIESELIHASIPHIIVENKILGVESDTAQAIQKILQRLGRSSC